MAAPITTEENDPRAVINWPSVQVSEHSRLDQPVDLVRFVVWSFFAGFVLLAWVLILWGVTAVL